MRCLIVHNPRSGFGSDAVFAFERELVAAGDECVLRVLGEECNNEEVLADAEGFDVVVLSGGDGTVSNLLYALRGRSIDTCVFPSGTANLLFANIGNSAEPAALARACRWGNVATCDLGEARWDHDGASVTRGFSIMAGTGFDAELMTAAAPNKKAMGEAAYFMAALADPKPRSIHYTIEVDGKVHERDGIACLVANNAMIQLDMEIVPDCTMDDGMLDVIVLEASYTAELLRPLVRGLLDPKGRTKRPTLETFRGRSISITASEPVPMQVDGEVLGIQVTHWDANVFEGANNLIVDDLSRYHPSSPRTKPRYPVAAELAFPE